MSDEKPAVGTITWRDLTVPNAEQVRDFYQAVVGWGAEGCDMGGYEDFNMTVPGTGEGIAGVCHARGCNEGIPAQWLIYIMVQDVEASARTCVELGGAVVMPVKDLGDGKFCVIRDPAGAVCALFEP